jgi:hypothetical protein
MVARICASYERDRNLARELAQDVWFAIWRALPHYEPTRRSRPSWRASRSSARYHTVTQHAREPFRTALTEASIRIIRRPNSPSSRRTSATACCSPCSDWPLVYRQPVHPHARGFFAADIAAMLGLSVNVIAGPAHSRTRTAARNAPHG